MAALGLSCPLWQAMKTFSISQIARACGLSRSTLLFYDRLGLLRSSGRTGAGYRVCKVASGKRPRCVDKQMWIEMLKAAGMDQSAMNRWHAECESRSPDGHQEFLLSLGIPPNEAARIRRVSRGQAGT